MNNIPTSCPTCGQKDFQRVSMARAAGTSVGTTSGVALGSDARGNVGVAGYRGTTVNKTELARSLSFEQMQAKRKEWMQAVWILAAIEAFLLYGVLRGIILREFDVVHFWMFIVAVGVGAGIYGCFQKIPSRADIESERLLQRQMDEKWLCHRCGHMWDGGEAGQ